MHCASLVSLILPTLINVRKGWSGIVKGYIYRAPPYFHSLSQEAAENGFLETLSVLAVCVAFVFAVWDSVPLSIYSMEEPTIRAGGGCEIYSVGLGNTSSIEAWKSWHSTINERILEDLILNVTLNINLKSGIFCIAGAVF